MKPLSDIIPAPDTPPDLGYPPDPEQMKHMGQNKQKIRLEQTNH